MLFLSNLVWINRPGSLYESSLRYSALYIILLLLYSQVFLIPVCIQLFVYISSLTALFIQLFVISKVAFENLNNILLYIYAFIHYFVIVRSFKHSFIHIFVTFVSLKDYYIHLFVILIYVSGLYTFICYFFNLQTTNILFFCIEPLLFTIVHLIMMCSLIIFCLLYSIIVYPL